MPSDQELNAWLRRSIENSLIKGYHNDPNSYRYSYNRYGYYGNGYVKYHQRYQTSKRPCKNFAATGTCIYGKNCKFAHVLKLEQANMEAPRLNNREDLPDSEVSSVSSSSSF
jgi:hypothetical protein